MKATNKTTANDKNTLDLNRVYSSIKNYTVEVKGMQTTGSRKTCEKAIRDAFGDITFSKFEELKKTIKLVKSAEQIEAEKAREAIKTEKSANREAIKAHKVSLSLLTKLNSVLSVNVKSEKIEAVKEFYLVNIATESEVNEVGTISTRQMIKKVAEIAEKVDGFNASLIIELLKK